MISRPPPSYRKDFTGSLNRFVCRQNQPDPSVPRELTDVVLRLDPFAPGNPTVRRSAASRKQFPSSPSASGRCLPRTTRGTHKTTRWFWVSPLSALPFPRSRKDENTLESDQRPRAVGEPSRASRPTENGTHRTATAPPSPLCLAHFSRSGVDASIATDRTILAGPWLVKFLGFET